MNEPLFRIVDGVPQQFSTEEADALRAEWAATAAAAAVTAPVPTLSRPLFCVALTKTNPPIFTPAEALAALENFPPKFMLALADRPLEYQAAAIMAWRETKTVARDAPLFLDLLAYYASAAGLNEAQAQALGDQIFAVAA